MLLNKKRQENKQVDQIDKSCSIIVVVFWPTTLWLLSSCNLYKLVRFLETRLINQDVKSCKILDVFQSISLPLISLKRKLALWIWWLDELARGRTEAIEWLSIMYIILLGINRSKCNTVSVIHYPIFCQHHSSSGHKSADEGLTLLKQINFLPFWQIILHIFRDFNRKIHHEYLDVAICEYCI